jgi:hypothetical protein
MSKKHLDESVIVNELKGSSLFFSTKQEVPAPTTPPREPAPSQVEPAAGSQGSDGNRIVNREAAELIRNAPPGPIKGKKKEASEQDSYQASTIAGYDDGLINDIRKTVKGLGKEVSFLRLTSEEKNQLVDIVYSYKRQGVKTSENEIHRIAINFLLEDYKANGEASMLARVIEALLA